MVADSLLYAPFQGWVYFDRVDPGRRFALPWADLLRPLRGDWGAPNRVHHNRVYHNRVYRNRVHHNRVHHNRVHQLTNSQGLMICPYLPLYSGFLFSTNAFIPSFWSSVAKSM